MEEVEEGLHFLLILLRAFFFLASLISRGFLTPLSLRRVLCGL